MGKEFDFKSQICTDRFQSERLLSLGLKPETADMSLRYSDIGGNYNESVYPYSSILALKERMNKPILGMEWEDLYGRDIPAWSLGRLIEMYAERYISCSMNLKDLTYEWIINEIEIHIKERDFNKKYLV